jgi:hypothetical protein
MPKEHTPPEFLYKYRSLACDIDRERVQEIITTYQIYYPAPEQINDPFDCRMPPIKSSTPWWTRSRIAATEATTDSERVDNWHKFEESRPRSDAELEELNKPLSADEQREFGEIFSSEIKAKLKTTGVLSLCAINDNVLMWSHYADSHKGVCLKFCLEKWPDLKTNILPVCYPKERLLLQLDSETLKTEQAVEALVLTKDPSWAYECEWRSLARSPGKNSFPEVALVGIILGCQISPGNEKWLRSILPSSGRIKLYRAEKKTKEFGLDIQAL